MTDVPPQPPEAVVLIHGLYMHALCLEYLAHHLRRAGFVTYRFSYPSLRRCAPDNARELGGFLETLHRPRLHFVAHSLGGLVLRHLLDQQPHLPPGRAVTLGTPHQGSVAARDLYRRGWKPLLGESLQALLADVPPWPEGRELGSLAGTRNTGLGRVLAPAVVSPADGTVRVAETYMTGMTDHICLPVSHSSMLISPAVAHQTLAFLRRGRFDHGGR